MGMRRVTAIAALSLTAVLFLAGCSAGPAPTATALPSPTACSGSGCPATQPPPTLVPTRVIPTAAQQTESVVLPLAGAAGTPCPDNGCPTPTGQTAAVLPVFSHVVMIILENHEIGFVIGNTQQMPYLNQLAGKFTLLDQFYGVTHPSLPNYIAMISGSTQGIQSDCTNCFLQGKNLADLIESTQRTWKAYQEDMPSNCFVGSSAGYAQKHDPFIYFDDIRLNQGRCQNSIVPLTQLDTDLAGSGLPNYSFISPNLCNSAHDCGLDYADKFLGTVVPKIMNSSSYDDHTLIVITFDEGQGNHSCCGLGQQAGGQVATVLVSPLVKSGFKDETPYSHYSILKTLAAAWGFTELGHAADAATSLIVAPWK